MACNMPWVDSPAVHVHICDFSPPNFQVFSSHPMFWQQACSMAYSHTHMLVAVGVPLLLELLLTFDRQGGRRDVVGVNQGDWGGKMRLGRWDACQATGSALQGMIYIHTCKYTTMSCRLRAILLYKCFRCGWYSHLPLITAGKVTHGSGYQSSFLAG